VLFSHLQESLQALKQRACAAFGVDPQAVLLWDYFEACRFILLEDQLHCTLQQARLLDGQALLLDPIPQVSIMHSVKKNRRCTGVFKRLRHNKHRAQRGLRCITTLSKCIVLCRCVMCGLVGLLPMPCRLANMEQVKGPGEGSANCCTR
jgi:hypothetical protein